MSVRRNWCLVDSSTGGRTQPSDRLLAVAAVSQTFENRETIDNLPQRMMVQMREFIVTWPRLLGERSTSSSGRGPEEAQRLMEKAIRNR